MSDAALRTLERRAEAEGDHEAEARTLVYKIRSGGLRTQAVELAALCGSKPARIAIGQDPSPFRDLMGLAQFGDLMARRDWDLAFRRAATIDQYGWLVAYTCRAMGHASSGEEEPPSLEASRGRWACLGLALVEFLRSPKTARDRQALSGALNAPTIEGVSTPFILGAAIHEVATSLGTVRPPAIEPLWRVADEKAHAGAWVRVPDSLVKHLLGNPPRFWWENTIPAPACRTCGDAGRELIDCDGSAGYRPCQACARRSS